MDPVARPRRRQIALPSLPVSTDFEMGGWSPFLLVVTIDLLGRVVGQRDYFDAGATCAQVYFTPQNPRWNNNKIWVINKRYK